MPVAWTSSKVQTTSILSCCGKYTATSILRDVDSSCKGETTSGYLHSRWKGKGVETSYIFPARPGSITTKVWDEQLALQSATPTYWKHKTWVAFQTMTTCNILPWLLGE